jgi:ABC-2 type transport system ATP-binding protein
MTAPKAGKDLREEGTGQVVAAGSADGSIYDLGYRGYRGARLGRRHAVASLVKQSFRQSWGLGRPGRAKIIPIGLAVIATLPAVVALGVSALANQLGVAEFAEAASPIRYETYYPLIGQVVFLFAAAQAPELLARDQRHRVLALYFSRAIRREDYALGKLMALGAAMLVLILVPQLLILVGRILLAADIPAAVGDEVPQLLPIVGQALITAWLLAALSLALAAFTPRRAYATAAIFAVVLVPTIAAATLSELGRTDVASAVSLASPADVLEGVNAFVYGQARAGPEGVRAVPGQPLPADAPPSSMPPPPPATGALPPDATIVLDRASRWYGNVVACNDVSFAIGPGVTGLLGPNGAGKSTILGMIAGLLPPSAGTVTLLGAPAWRHPELYRRVGLVPERESVPTWLTGRGFVRYAARLQGLEDPDTAAAGAIARMDLTDAADRRTSTYSKGMRQRILLAAALVHEPPVLLLDEPFNGLDPRQRLHMMDLLRELAAAGRTILFSSHILEEVERLADRVLVVHAGRLAAWGDFREIRRLMTNRPHTYLVRSSDDRSLASRLIANGVVGGAELRDGWLEVRTTDLIAFGRLLPRIARDAGVSLFEVRPTDESLEHVFAYLVQR